MSRENLHGGNGKRMFIPLHVKSDYSLGYVMKDRQGLPFVGPAGHLLDKACGICGVFFIYR